MALFASKIYKKTDETQNKLWKTNANITRAMNAIGDNVFFVIR